MAINSTTIWRIRPSGSNLNGGGYDPAIAGAGTDYSQQNAAQVSGTNGSASGTTSFTASGFTSAMVGNAINIAGQGVYFVVTYNSATVVVVDRALGTFSGASWRLGGGWGDASLPFDNLKRASAILVPGNTVYLLGTNVPNPASYTYDYTPSNYNQGSVGNQLDGFITISNDPATPAGGYPVISCPGLVWFDYECVKFINIWCVATGTAFNGFTYEDANATNSWIGCVFDQNGYDVSFGAQTHTSRFFMFNCEFFSSVAKRSTNAQYAITIEQHICVLSNCNIHDCIGPAIRFLGGEALGTIENCIIAKNGGTAIITENNNHDYWLHQILNCTIDGNAGNAIEFTAQPCAQEIIVKGNLITNHTTGTGIIVNGGTMTQNDKVKTLIDYNTFYNNLANYSAISAGAHDVALSSSPYANQSTQDYRLV